MANADNIIIQSVVLNKQYINNAKAQRGFVEKGLNNEHFGPGQNMVRLQFNYNDNKSKFAILELHKDANVKLPRPISPLEGAILDTIYSIYKAGYTCFTISQIAQVFTGNAKKQITPKLARTIEESIDMLADLGRAELDLSNEPNEDLSKLGTIKGRILPLITIHPKAVYAANGRPVKETIYALENCPLLHWYAEKRGKGEIIDVDIKLLDTSDTDSSDTTDYTLVKRYILARIKQIKHKKNKLTNNKISLEWKKGDDCKGLLDRLGYHPDSSAKWRKNKAELLKDIKNVLDYCVKSGEITGYKEYRADGSNNPTKPIQGFEIFF